GGFLHCMVRKLDRGKWLWRIQGVLDEQAVVDDEIIAKEMAIAMMRSKLQGALSELEERE
ncbi:MAG TPA: hypothetical protein V6C63_11170, partial [Allocoleopsis sp.]